jgi:hypothetical protein
MVTEAMHTWAAGLKEQLIKIEINMKATSKESLNAKVIWWDQGLHWLQKRTEQQKSVHTSTEQQGVTVRIKPEKQAPRPPLEGNWKLIATRMPTTKQLPEFKINTSLRKKSYIHVGSPQNRAVPPGVGNFSDTSGNRLPKSTRHRKRLFWRNFLRVSYAHIWQSQSSYHKLEVRPKIS